MMTSVMYEPVLYHCVPSTPCFTRSPAHDAEVPDSYFNSAADVQPEVLVPTTPLINFASRRQLSSQRARVLLDQGFASPVPNTLVKETRRKDTPFNDLFDTFGEQIVPSTPRGCQRPATPSVTPRYATMSPPPCQTPRQTPRRHQVTRTRMARTPITQNGQSVYQKKSQLDLFSGDEIFA